MSPQPQDTHIPYSEEILSTILRHAIEVERQVCDGKGLPAQRNLILIFWGFMLVALPFSDGRHDQCEVEGTENADPS